MTFTQKFLEFDFSLATGSFQSSTGGTGNSYTVTGLRASADILKAGGISLGAANLAIYGLPLSVMNQLSTYGNVLTTQGRNSVTVKAWETGHSPTIVYQGDIYAASMDGQAQPDVAFRVQANVGLYAQAKPVQPTTQPGSQSVATLMQTVAGKAGFQFENNGVNVQVRNPYLGGTAIQQMHDLVEMAGIEHIVDNGTLAIWPAGQARTAAGKTIISPQTGLVSYPLFDSQGIIVRTLWQPTLAFGQTITVQSSIPAACKDWTIYKLAYNLASMEENGPWFCDVWAWNPQLAPTAPVA